jgi:hypothetical protein
MSKPGLYLSFEQKPRAGVAEREHLQGVVGVEVEMPNPVDHRGAAFTEELLDAVPLDDAADGEGTEHGYHLAKTNADTPVSAAALPTPTVRPPSRFAVSCRA